MQSVTKAILVHIATFPALLVHLGTDVEAVVFQNALMSIVTLSKDVFILQEKEQQHHQSVILDILAQIAIFPALSVNLVTDVEAVVFQTALMSFATMSKDV